MPEKSSAKSTKRKGNPQNLKPWKPGQSGNPKGKKVGTRDRRTVIWEAIKKIPIAILLPFVIAGFAMMGAALVFFASGPGLVVIAALTAIVLTLRMLIKEGWLTHQAWLEVWDGIKIIAAEGANAVITVIESMINWVIAQINSLIEKINAVLRAAQKIPGVGKKIGTLSTISSLDLGRFSEESDLVNSRSLASRTSVGTSPSLTITGNTFLSEDAAERMGDLILSRLKMSAAL